MIITWFNEILNVWANDAAKVSVFIFSFSLPFLVYIIFSLFKDYFKTLPIKRDIIYLFFLITVILNIISIVGFVQIILPPLFDALVRSFGIFIYLTALFFYIVLLRFIKSIKKNTHLFNSEVYSVTRNPDILLLFFIVSGFSLLAVSLTGIIFSLFVFLPLAVIKLKNEEKELLKTYKEYFDCKNNIPLLFPNVLRSFKSTFYGRIKK